MSLLYAYNVNASASNKKLVIDYYESMLQKAYRSADKNLMPQHMHRVSE